MNKGDKLFVRIDYRNNDVEFGPKDFEDHLRHLENVAKNRLFMGGGFEGEKGGMIIYRAKNIEEAKEIADNDPIIKKGLYTYKMYEWKLVIVSENLK